MSFEHLTIITSLLCSAIGIFMICVSEGDVLLRRMGLFLFGLGLFFITIVVVYCMDINWTFYPEDAAVFYLKLLDFCAFLNFASLLLFLYAYFKKENRLMWISIVCVSLCGSGCTILINMAINSGIFPIYPV